MKKVVPSLLGGLVAVLCLAARVDASILRISPNSSVRATATEVEANYTTTHLYINEVAGDSIPITIFFDPQAVNIATCELYTNLNRRDRAQLDADGDGIEDGIKPVDGNLVTAGSDAHYFKAYTMSLVSGGYQLTLNANKTGAYRLTARYRFNGESVGTWHYYGAETANGYNKRDHCFVISPRKARDIILYEVNPLTIIAEGTLASQRGTFADLANGLGSGHSPRFNLNYVKSLGANTLWFQPIHPNGIDGRQTDPVTSQPFEVGSPYAVKNFFEVMPLMAKGFTGGSTPASNDTPAGRAQAMTEFQSFATAADAGNVDIMLDAPFNHTSYDSELAAIGQTLLGNGGTNQNTQIRNTEARFFARTNAYDMRAFSSGSIALAPDRTDFGKFADTYEVYYGRYAALVSGSTPGYQNEADWFDYSIGNESSAGDGNGHFDAITQKVWKYFAEYTLFWLTQTGYPANPTGATLNSNAGIDSLRADFGQGLPPQCWEYIINKTRTRKWNFTFMAESLDGGAVTKRSARHFDILNENIVFPLHAAQNTNDFRNIYESRRTDYGQAMVLLNSSSHDEDHYQDPWHALIRYAANSSIDGVPLIFPGQELGLSGAVVPPGDTQTNPPITPFGYDRYETNFGKPIPHFKKFNSLMPLWLKTTPGDPTYNYGLAQLAKVYEGIGQARKNSAALKSSNRYFINLNDNTPHGQIFSVAKFENRNGAPNQSDVVFAFVNLDRNSTPGTVGSNKYNVNIDTDANGVNDFGIKAGRTYNTKNIAAYQGTDPNRRTYFTMSNIAGSDLLSQGLPVSLNPVPSTDGTWATAPYEAKYLKLYDVTPPPAPAAPGADMVLYGTVVGHQVTFNWSAAADPEGGVSGFYLQIGTAPNAFDLFNGTTNATGQSVTVPYGTTVYARVQQISNAGVYGPYSTASAAVTALDPAADNDGDGQSNAAETTAGTDPRSSTSVLRATAFAISGANVNVTVATVAGKNYQFEKSTNLSSWSPVGGVVNATSATTVFADPGGAGGGKKFYRARIVP